MPIPVDQARTILTDLESRPIANLFAQAHAKHVLREVGESPENFPAFDSNLDDKITFATYAMLAAGCSLIEQDDRDSGAGTLARAASLLQYIHGPRTESRESGFHVLVAGMAFYAAGQYSRAFVVLRDVEQRTLAARVIASFLRKDVRSLVSDISNVLLVDPPAMEEQAELNEWAITVAIARALSVSLEFTMVGAVGLRGFAERQLRDAEIVARVGDHAAWWWVVRLLRLMLEDLGEASPWTVLPPFFGPASSDELSRYCRLLAFGERQVTELWESQRAALPLALSTSNRGGVVNLRTSAGKTRVAELAILQALLSAPGARVLYLAPFRALALEVEHSLESTFTHLGFGVSHLYGGSRVSSVDTELASESAITIATPEKARALLRAEPELFRDVRLVVLDEGHLVGPSERYVRNEVFVDHIRGLVRALNVRILLLSAVLPNPQELAQWVTGDPSAVATSSWKPSAERFGLLRWDGSRVRIDWQGEVASFNPSFVVAAALGFGMRRDPFPRNKNEAVAAAAIRLSTIGPVMIFTARANSVRGLTEAVLLGLGEHPTDHPWPDHEWRVFEAVCREDLGDDSLELRAVQAGVVCHSNRLTPQVRLAVDLLMRAMPPKVIVATTTLAQGVNVGISSVIIATPYLNTKPIDRRDFWNICGRAGRAFVDGEGKILYAIDQTRLGWQVAKDEELARNYFQAGATEPVESGLLFVVRLLRKIAGRAGVSFELLLELAAQGDFARLGDNARDCETICDLIDDQMLALHGDPLINPSAAGPEVWIDQLFRGSLAAIQSREGTAEVNQDDVLKFLRARVVSALARVPEQAQRRAIVSSGLPLRAAIRVQAALDDFCAVADQFDAEGGTPAALATAVRSFETWACLNARSVINETPDSSVLDAVRDGWLAGVALSELTTLDAGATSVCRGFYGYELPWIVHAVSQQLRSGGDEERAETVARIALLIELGLPNEVAARVFLAGVRSRVAAAELSLQDVRYGSTVAEVRGQLRSAAFRAQLRPLVSEACAIWLDLVAGRAAIDERLALNFPDIVLASPTDATMLHARQVAGENYLCDAEGTTKIRVSSTDEMPFDRVANDPRLAFLRVGDVWRLVVRDPRLGESRG